MAYASPRAPGRLDYAGGHVLYSLPGRPALPVRLSGEMFRSAWPAGAGALYDPLQGGYLLTVLGPLQGLDPRLIGSDIDAGRCGWRAQSEPAGGGRVAAARAGAGGALGCLWQGSHRAALEALERLQAFRPLTPFHALFRPMRSTRGPWRNTRRGSGGCAITDLPYGLQTQWQSLTLPMRASPSVWRPLSPAPGVGALRS